MSMSTPEAPNPAKRPERDDTIKPEDIEVDESGDEEEERGRKALRRPVRNTGRGPGSKGGVGTGLRA